MTHYQPIGNNEYSAFMHKHGESLKNEFFNHILSYANGIKPLYVRNNGETLYQHTINSISLKLCSKILDDSEKSILSWNENEHYRYTIRRTNTILNQKIPTWNLLLNTFDHVMEQCLFNIAYPPATISYHYGVASHCYRVHWCLQNNPAFVFDLEGEKKQWEEGIDNMFRFDDGKLFHGVICNESLEKNPRIVCIMDIKKSYWD